MNDPIVDEIHRGRREHAQRFNNNLAAFVADLKQREAEDSEPYLSVPVGPRPAPAKIAPEIQPRTVSTTAR